MVTDLEQQYAKARQSLKRLLHNFHSSPNFKQKTFQTIDTINNNHNK